MTIYFTLELSDLKVVKENFKTHHKSYSGLRVIQLDVKMANSLNQRY